MFPNVAYLRSDPPFRTEVVERKRASNVPSKEGPKWRFPYPHVYETSQERYKKEIHSIFEEIQYVFPVIKKVDIKTAEQLLDMYLGKNVDRKHRWKKKVLALALLILATKMNNTQTFSVKKVEKLYSPESITIKDVRRAYKDVVKTLRIKIPGRPKEEEIRVLSKFRRKYGRDEDVERLMKRLYEETKKKKIGIGRTKKTVLAAIAYIAYKIYEYRITQRESAKLAGITEIPLREMVKEILRKVQIDINI
jgi:transcription initiation factor TFIIIB Brf1 subunit/transcription initiation factor TFIIB